MGTGTEETAGRLATDILHPVEKADIEHGRETAGVPLGDDVADETINHDEVNKIADTRYGIILGKNNTEFTEVHRGVRPGGLDNHHSISNAKIDSAAKRVDHVKNTGVAAPIQGGSEVVVAAEIMLKLTGVSKAKIQMVVADVGSTWGLRMTQRLKLEVRQAMVSEVALSWQQRDAQQSHECDGSASSNGITLENGNIDEKKGNHNQVQAPRSALQQATFGV